MNYNKTYQKVLRYSGADHSTVETLTKSLTPEQLVGTKHADKNTDWEPRLVLSDALEDHGRREEAEHVRNLETPLVRNSDGTFQPGVVKYRDVHFSSGNIDTQDLLDSVAEMGPANTLAQKKQDYDYGTGSLLDEPAHNEHDQVYKHGNHILSWRPSYNYIGLQERHILPLKDNNAFYKDTGGLHRLEMNEQDGE